MRTALVTLLALACCGQPVRARHVAARPAPSVEHPAPPRTYDEHDVLIAPVAQYGSSVWFADELASLADAIADAFTARPAEGFRPVPPRELRALYLSVREGRLPGVASVCAAVPPPALLAETIYAGASTAESRIECDDKACLLEVIVRRNANTERAKQERELARFTVALPRTGSPPTWSETIRAQGFARVPPPEEGGGLLGALAGGNLAPGTYASLDSVEQSGAWSTPLTSALVQPHAIELHACSASAPKWRDWWGQPLVVEVGADGRIARCEDSYPHHLPEPGLPCRCAVLRKLELGAAKPGRRARFYLRTYRVEPAAAYKSDGLSRSVYLTKKEADDPSAVLGTANLDDVRANACLRGIAQPIGSHEVPVAFTVGPDGHALAHQVTWPAVVDATLRACLGDVLERAQFDCPLSGHANVKAVLALKIAPWSLAKPTKATP